MVDDGDRDDAERDIYKKIQEETDLLETEKCPTCLGSGIIQKGLNSSIKVKRGINHALKTERALFCPICGNQISKDILIKDIEVNHLKVPITEAYHFKHEKMNIFIIITEKK